MHISFFTQNFQNYISGGRFYGWHIAHCLARLGHRVTIFTDNIPLFDKEYENFKGKENVEIVKDNYYGMRTKNRSKLKQSDLVITAPVESTDVGVTHGKICGKKIISIVFEPVNVILEAVQSGIEIPWSTRHEEVHRDFSMQVHKSDAIIVSNDYSVEALKGWLPVYSGKVFSLYNSFRIDIAEQIKRQEKEYAIAFCSRTVKYKGYGDIPYVFGQLENKPKIYYITGFLDRMDRETTGFFDLCKNEAGLNVEILQKIDEKTKFEVLSKCKALYFPSRFEGFGLPPAEAFSVGTPVICYDLPILKEVYKEYPHYIPFNDFDYAHNLVKGLLEDEQTLNRNLQEAEEYVKGFAGLDVFCKKLDDIVNSVMKNQSVKISNEVEVKVQPKKEKRVINKSNKLAVIVIGKDNGMTAKSLESQNFKDFNTYFFNENVVSLETFSEKYVILCRDDLELNPKTTEEIMIRFDNEDVEVIYGNYKLCKELYPLPDFTPEVLFSDPGFINGLVACRNDGKTYKISQFWEFEFCLENLNKKWLNCRRVLYGTERKHNHNNPIVTEQLINLLETFKIEETFSTKCIENGMRKLHVGQQEESVFCVILFRNHKYIKNLLDSIKYKNIEISLVYHDPEDKNESWVEELMQYESVTLIHRYNEEFNYSKMNNMAIDCYRGDAQYFLLLNDDVVLQKDAINQMVATFKYRFDDVGVVGSKLLYPNFNDRLDDDYDWTKDSRLIQHAGATLLSDKYCTHFNMKRHSCKLSANYIRDVDAVTFACVMIDADLYDAIQLDENIPIDFNDMDFCMRARKKGFRVVYNPYSVALHFETATRVDYDLVGNKSDQKIFYMRYKNICDTRVAYQELKALERVGF